MTISEALNLLRALESPILKNVVAGAPFHYAVARNRRLLGDVRDAVRKAVENDVRLAEPYDRKRMALAAQCAVLRSGEPAVDASGRLIIGNTAAYAEGLAKLRAEMPEAAQASDRVEAALADMGGDDAGVSLVTVCTEDVPDLPGAVFDALLPMISG